MLVYYFFGLVVMTISMVKEHTLPTKRLLMRDIFILVLSAPSWPLLVYFIYDERCPSFGGIELLNWRKKIDDND